MQSFELASTSTAERMRTQLTLARTTTTSQSGGPQFLVHKGRVIRVRWQRYLASEQARLFALPALFRNRGEQFVQVKFRKALLLVPETSERCRLMPLPELPDVPVPYWAYDTHASAPHWSQRSPNWLKANVWAAQYSTFNINQQAPRDMSSEPQRCAACSAPVSHKRRCSRCKQARTCNGSSASALTSVIIGLSHAACFRCYSAVNDAIVQPGHHTSSPADQLMNSWWTLTSRHAYIRAFLITLRLYNLVSKL